jgi:hypothetical protein
VASIFDDQTAGSDSESLALAMIFDWGCNGWLQLTSGALPDSSGHIRFVICYIRSAQVMQA